MTNPVVIPQFEFKLPPPKQNARGTVWFFCCARVVGFGLRTVIGGGGGGGGDATLDSQPSE
jgi:hypothetical protein